MLPEEYQDKKIVFLCYCPGCITFFYISVGCFVILLVAALVLVYSKSSRPLDIENHYDCDSSEAVYETRL
jgi:hypothetical protein